MVCQDVLFKVFPAQSIQTSLPMEYHVASSSNGSFSWAQVSENPSPAPLSQLQQVKEGWGQQVEAWVFRGVQHAALHTVLLIDAERPTGRSWTR